MARRKRSVRDQLGRILREWEIDESREQTLVHSIKASMVWERLALSAAEALEFGVKLPAYRLDVYMSQRRYIVWATGDAEVPVKVLDPDHPNKLMSNEPAALIRDELGIIASKWNVSLDDLLKKLALLKTVTATHCCVPARELDKDEARDFHVSLPAFILQIRTHGLIVFLSVSGKTRTACISYTGDLKAMKMEGRRMGHGARSDFEVEGGSRQDD
ncbi:hypothetical protein EXS71_01180 [Candidatus Uhrbacteria bacterium]|nr:hypothetical protein [Candidatus Uhrbacteria bacterium]